MIFTQGVDLPGFAAFPLLETEDGTEMLRSYFRSIADLGRAFETGVIFESPTWVANRDRAQPLGYGPERLSELNVQSIAMMVRERAAAPDVPIVLSANVGPRADAYAPASQMTASEAEDYHAEQLEAVSRTAVDMISGYTLAYVAEAVGLAWAAQRHDLPVVISFTVETDGRLPNGMPLATAVAEVDAQTDRYPAYYMVNCAHPDHFGAVLEDQPWMARVQGIVANASRCSHAELDEASELDDGDPAELGLQLASLRQRFPLVRVLGGCCGTDMRHMHQIAKAATTRA